MLASTQVQGRGIGNQHDQVGRYFQDHIHMNLGELRPVNRAQLQDIFESFFVAGLKLAPLVTLTRDVQVEKRLLSIHGIVAFEPGPDSSIAAMKKLFRAIIGKSLPNAPGLARLAAKSLASPGKLLRLVYRLKVRKRAATPSKGPILFGA